MHYIQSLVEPHGEKNTQIKLLFNMFNTDTKGYQVLCITDLIVEKEHWKWYLLLFVRVYKDTSVSKWWQGFHYWVNCSFNTAIPKINIIGVKYTHSHSSPSI